MAHNPLGRHTEYVSQYAPQLLFPIARASARQLLPAAELPFFGADLWTGYELSWLDARGKPQVAVAEFILPSSSEFMVESKSFKLYLNSFNQTRLESPAQLQQMLVRDLSAAVGAAVEVRVFGLQEQSALHSVSSLPAFCVDDLPIAIEHYHPHPEYLRCLPEGEVIAQSLCSHLLKTNCPVTGQPDWASVYVQYRGRAIDPEALLRYIVSFREHQDYHEHCVERMFLDIWQRCSPEELTVYARYTRRGGLDINPLRSSHEQFALPSWRLLRQ